MIFCKELNKEYNNHEEMFKDLITSKHDVMAQKKMVTKHADTVTYQEESNTTNKATVIGQEIDKITLKLVINTTNLMDSHSDVHIKGLWNKSVKEKKDLYLLQEHKMAFDSIITDDVKAEVLELNWKDLKYKFDGTTEALVFNAKVSKERNQFMFNQYAKGYVKNHSVGMRYVKIDLAVNSDNSEYKEEKAIWDKYISEVSNKKKAEEQGYFWAVTEAKIIEGSAVPMGSNEATPVLNIEPSDDTQKTEAVISNTSKGKSKIYMFN